MSQSIIEALFYGKIIPWERHSCLNSEHQDLENKIESEKRYFIEKMPPDDSKRFQELEALYGSLAYEEAINIYTHGFTLGTLLALEVIEKKEAIINA